MKLFLKISLAGLIWVSFALNAVSQPCVNGISTNPYNPVNNQFLPLANQWYPGNGTDTHNPWLNQWSWYWSDGNPTIYRDNLNWDHQWPGNAPSVAMVHPYDILMPEGFEYLRPAGVHPDFYDYRWEDGWELLWMNMGYYPDGHAINNPATGSYYDNHNWDYEPLPSNAPYFAIYNRYRGILRLFANVWYSAESTFEDIDVVLRFTNDSGILNRLTGILRNASAYDIALSEPTEIKSIHAPRFHAPDLTQWIVADFQIGYDPCSCMSTGELIFDFNAFSTLDVDIVGRTVAIDVPINDTTYTTRGFLNMSEVNVGEYVPGTEIYQNMDRLAEEFEKKQRKYLEDLEEYNQTTPFSLALQKFAIKQVAKYLTGGLSSILISDSLLTWVTNDDWREATSLEDLSIGIEPQNVKNKFADKAKGLIGESVGFLSTEIFSPAPSKPTPPAVPVATLEESVYKGTIVNTSTRASAPMIIPGSLSQAWEPATPLSPHRLPVYNEVLGQVALLETPNVDFYFAPDTVTNILSYEDEGAPNGGGVTCYVTKEFRSKVDFKLKFDEELKIALSNALDFDYDQTKTYVQVNLKLGNDVEVADQYLYDSGDFNYYSEINQGTNMNLDRQFVNSNQTKLEFNSKWIPLEELNQVVFQLLYEEVFEFTGTSFNYYADECDVNDPFGMAFFDYEIDQLNIKLMHDMYFDQIGSSNVQVNTIQINTYQLYDQATGINHLADESTWSTLTANFEAYTPGEVTLGSELIDTNHPAVTSVMFNGGLVIDAQKVLITAGLNIEEGYSLTINALEEIKIVSGVQLSPSGAIDPRIHLNIKKDFYNTPVFEYADNAEVASFCSSTNYQAHIDAAAISTNNEIQDQETRKEYTKVLNERGSIQLYPNPARDQLTLRSSHLDMSVITIFDLPGKPIKQQNLQAYSRVAQINLSGIAPGTYIVRVDCGDEIFSEKLVVTK